MELIDELSVLGRYRYETIPAFSEIIMGNLVHWCVWSLLMGLAYGVIGYFSLAGSAYNLSESICIVFVSISVLLAGTEFIKKFGRPFIRGAL